MKAVDGSLKEVQDGVSKLKAERDELLAALKDAASGFHLAYLAGTKRFSDEVLLHCGVHGARARAAIAKAEEGR